jgi:hypothetical protein
MPRSSLFRLSICSLIEAARLNCCDVRSSGFTAAIDIFKAGVNQAALTKPSDFASSMNWRAYAAPRSRPFGIAMACGSRPGTVEDPRIRQLIQRLEQAWLDAEDYVGFPRFQHLQCASETWCSDHHGIFQVASKKNFRLGLLLDRNSDPDGVWSRQETNSARLCVAITLPHQLQRVERGR